MTWTITLKKNKLDQPLFLCLAVRKQLDFVSHWKFKQWNSWTEMFENTWKSCSEVANALRDDRFNLLYFEKPFIYRIFRPSRFLMLKALNMSAVTVRNWWVDTYLLDHDFTVCQQKTRKLWHGSKQTVRGQRQHIWFQIVLPSAVVNRGCKLFTEASASWATVAATCLCHGSPVGEDQNTLQSNTRSSYQSHFTALGEKESEESNYNVFVSSRLHGSIKITLNERLSIFKISSCIRKVHSSFVVHLFEY